MGIGARLVHPACSWSGEHPRSLPREPSTCPQSRVNVAEPPRSSARRVTWVGVDAVGIDGLRGGLPVGLRRQRAEAVHPDRRGDAGHGRCADARGGARTCRREVSAPAAPPRLLSRMGSKGTGVIPEEGVRGVATSPLTLKAAICCIWAAAMAAMGFRQVPCAAAIRAACCCMIFRKEREKKGKVSEWQREGGSRGGKISIPALHPGTEAHRDKCHPLPDLGTGGGLGDTKRGDTWDRCTLQPCHPHLGGEAFCCAPKWGSTNPDGHPHPLALVQAHAGFHGQNQPPSTRGAPPKPPGPSRRQLLPLAYRPRRRQTGWSWG